MQVQGENKLSFSITKIFPLNFEVILLLVYIFRVDSLTFLNARGSGVSLSIKNKHQESFGKIIIN